MGKNDSNDNNSDDAKLFRDAMRDTRPIKGPRRVSHDRQQKPQRRETADLRHKVVPDHLAAHSTDAEAGLGQRLTYQTSSVSRRRMRELSRGKLKIEAEIDLHGLTVSEARRELSDFLEECIHRGLSCIRIVHGKGKSSGARGPVVKSMTNSYLRQIDAVLAFCSALDKDGGTGAVYVLLSAG